MGLNPATVAILWSIILIATIIIEVFTPNLNTLWFSIGAALALLLQVIGVNNVALQFGVFLVTSVGLLFGMPYISRKYIIPKSKPSNIQEAIGKELLVVKGADKHNVGEGRFNGVIWSITCEGNDTVKAKDLAIITGILGNKLIVKKLKEKN
jgi:membrane protein implicated in regulation of membrane protease activity